MKKIRERTSKAEQLYYTLHNKPLAYNLIGLAIVIAFIIRIHFLHIPLERDEGEYAYMAQLLLHGILPYTEAYSMKLPGIYLIYAGILLIFGQTHTAIHLALLLINTATAILIFFIGRLLFNNLTGSVSAAAFLFMTLSPSVLGLWAHATHFIMLFASLGFLIMHIAIRDNNLKLLLLSGLLLGFIPLIKQHGIFFTLFGFGFACWRLYSGLIKKSAKDFIIAIGSFLLSIVFPYCCIIFLYLLTGNFSDFWLWTVQYPLHYVSLVQISEALNYFKFNFLRILKWNFTIFILFIIGLLGIFRYKEHLTTIIFLYGFLLASFLSILPGFYFRPHYFITLIPAICFFAGIGASFVMNKFSESKKKTIFALIATIIFLLFPLIYQYSFFKLSPHEASRYAYGYEPFPESIDVANYLAKNTHPEDKIVVLGSEPQIYFYSKRKAVTGYIYMYPLTEPQPFALKMQQDMIQKIEDNPPKYLIIVTTPSSWVFRHDSERLIYNWMLTYIDSNYMVSAVFDIISAKKTVFKYGVEAMTYKPLSPSAIFIYKKKVMN